MGGVKTLDTVLTLSDKVGHCVTGQNGEVARVRIPSRSRIYIYRNVSVERFQLAFDLEVSFPGLGRFIYYWMFSSTRRYLNPLISH
jgi:hypothetical protein